MRKCTCCTVSRMWCRLAATSSPFWRRPLGSASLLFPVLLGCRGDLCCLATIPGGTAGGREAGHYATVVHAGLSSVGMEVMMGKGASSRAVPGRRGRETLHWCIGQLETSWNGGRLGTATPGSKGEPIKAGGVRENCRCLHPRVARRGTALQGCGAKVELTIPESSRALCALTVALIRP